MLVVPLKAELSPDNIVVPLKALMYPRPVVPLEISAEISALSLVWFSVIFLSVVLFQTNEIFLASITPAFCALHPKQAQNLCLMIFHQPIFCRYSKQPGCCLCFDRSNQC